MPPYSEFFFSFVCVDRPKWRTVSNFNDTVMLHLANIIFTDIIYLIYLRGQSRENEIFPLPFPTYRGLPYKDDPIWVGWGGGNLTRLFEGDIQQTHLPRTLIFFSDEENQKNGWTGGVPYVDVDTSPKTRLSQLPKCFSSPKNRDPSPFKFRGARTTRLPSSPAL